MSRFNLVPLLILAVFVSAYPAPASTSYVGSCRSGSFSSISAAVGAVPAGSTILVCPGTYAEQVEITKALTLKGISSGNSGQAIIVIPGSGLATTTSIFFSPSVAPQLWVTAGPVDISNITVDGMGASCYGGWLDGKGYRLTWHFARQPILLAAEEAARITGKPLREEDDALKSSTWNRWGYNFLR
jgi:hypothetical protein